jgi:hypothetical protein
MSDSSATILIATAIDQAITRLGPLNAIAASELASRRAEFQARITPITTALLSEIANGGGQPAQVAMQEIEDAVLAFSFEVSAIQNADERAILQASIQGALVVFSQFLTSAVAKVGVAAVLAILA